MCVVLIVIFGTKGTGRGNDLKQCLSYERCAVVFFSLRGEIVLVDDVEDEVNYLKAVVYQTQDSLTALESRRVSLLGDKTADKDYTIGENYEDPETLKNNLLKIRIVGPCRAPYCTSILNIPSTPMLES